MSTTNNRSGMWRIVALREILVKLRDKAFIISTVSTLALVIGGIALSTWLGGRADTKQIAVTSDAGAALAQGVGQQQHAANDKKNVEIKRAADVTAGERMLRDGDADALLTQGSDGRWQIVVKQGGDMELTSAVTQTLTMQAMAQTATRAGTTMDQVMAQASVDQRALVGDEHRQTMGFVLGAAFSVLFMMSAMTYGMQIAQSVVEEKQSRIVEILLSTVTPRVIMAGKVIGNSILALIQVAAILAAAAIALAATGQGALFSLIGPGFIWFLVLFVFGFVLIATLYAGASAMVSRQEEVGSVTTPLMMLMLIPYMLVILFNSNALLMTILSYIPFSATIAMPLRVVLGQAEWWEPILALVILIATSAVSIMIGARIYENSILRIGGRVKLSDALKG